MLTPRLGNDGPLLQSLQRLIAPAQSSVLHSSSRPLWHRRHFSLSRCSGLISRSHHGLRVARRAATARCHSVAWRNALGAGDARVAPQRPVLVIQTRALSRKQLKAQRKPHEIIGVLKSLQVHTGRSALASATDRPSRRSSCDARSGPAKRRGDAQSPHEVKELRCLRLSDIVARYLKCIYLFEHHLGSAQVSNGPLNQGIGEVFTDAVLARLHGRGYDVQDVAAWAWILTASTSTLAVHRLALLGSQGETCDGRPRRLPMFLYLLLLRRAHIKASSLRTLAYRVQTHLEQVKAPALQSPLVAARIEGGSVSCEVAADSSTVNILLVRLLRHVQRVWPSAVPRVTQMMMGHLAPAVGDTSMRDPAKAARWTRLLNEWLRLLALPSSSGPFLTARIQERAQFMLVRRMSEYTPPVSITREGYRAVAKVQLARPKTPVEREWALRQAKSWPPWKKMRLGIDTVQGPEEGVGRAMDVLRQMRTAGYRWEEWEEGASIYAGWDTDDSPTIQTRTIVSPASTVSSRLCRSHDARARVSSEGDHRQADEMWAARITATRTIEEAWACFLAHEDSGAPRSRAIYAAMLTKLATWERQARGRERRKGSGPDAPSTAPPGDAQELQPSPASAHEAVYVRLEPPTLEDLYQQMIDDGIEPSDRCLAFLVERVRSLRQATRMIRTSGWITGASFHAPDGGGVVGGDPSNVAGGVPGRSLVRLLAKLPLCTFSAVLRRLRNHHQRLLLSPLRPRRDADSSSPSPLDGRTAETGAARTSVLVQLYQLLLGRRSRNREHWNCLLQTLARTYQSKASRRRLASEGILPDLLCWKLQGALVRQMEMLELEPDSYSFEMLCAGLVRSTRTSRIVREGGVEGHKQRIQSPQHINVGGVLPPVVVIADEAADPVAHGLGGTPLPRSTVGGELTCRSVPYCCKRDANPTHHRSKVGIYPVHAPQQ